MKVYVGYHYTNGDDAPGITDIKKVFDNEESAKAWVNEYKPTNWKWRDYEEHEVES